MAIKKALPFGQSGFDLTYWKIGCTVDNKHSSVLGVTMYGWKDSEERISNNTPADQLSIIIDGDDYKSDMTADDIYSYIKAQSLFVGSEDI